MKIPSLKIYLEGALVGVILVLFVYLSSFIVSKFNLKPSLPEICSTWNEKYVMEITIFLAGFLFHVVFEAFGLNDYYCFKRVA